MSEILFTVFKRIHHALRGSGLGKIKLLRNLRDWLYRSVNPGSPRVMELSGFKLWVDPSTAGGVVPWLMLDDIHEPAETRCMRDHLLPGGTFVDIGANIGYHTVLGATIVGERGRVYAFEPEPVNFETLKRNIELNNLRNVVAEAKACSERAGTLDLHIDKTNAGGHHLHDSLEASEAVSISAITLDDYFRDLEGSIDLIKMDIQGYESVALRGMLNLLGSEKRVKIITEFDAPMISAAGHSPTDFLATLQSLGYRFTILSDYGKSAANASPEKIISICTDGRFVNLFCDKEN